MSGTIEYRPNRQAEWEAIDPSRVTGDLPGSLRLDGQAEALAALRVGGAK